MQDRERRLALADFLRSRRGRLSPAQVGLPERTRRRTPGLRREEVAELANVGTAWYTALEQGRAIHPSEQVLESLAQALQLSPEERRHLFILAEKRMPSLPHPAEEQISPSLEHAIQNLDPHPAFVLGRRWDYIAWNKAADLLTGISRMKPPYERNRIWHIFTHLDHWEHVPGWEQYLQAILAEFRADAVRYPGDPWFEDLISDLQQASPAFREWWPHHEVYNILDHHKTIMHPELGELEFELLTAQIPNNPDLKLTIYTASPTTAAKLARCLSR